MHTKILLLVTCIFTSLWRCWITLKHFIAVDPKTFHQHVDHKKLFTGNDLKTNQQHVDLVLSDREDRSPYTNLYLKTNLDLGIYCFNMQAYMG